MVPRRWLLLLLSAAMLAEGCSFPVRQRVDSVVCDMAKRPYDLTPPSAATPAPLPAPPPAAPRATDGASMIPKRSPLPDIPTDVQTAAYFESPGSAAQPTGAAQPAGYAQPSAGQRKIDVEIPSQIPGSEVPRIVLPKNRELVDQQIDLIYPELPPLPAEPAPLPGPDGKPYTLSDLQRIAAANSPTLRQAAADVESYRGTLVQTKTYANPTFNYLYDPSNDNSTAGVQGVGIEQVIKTGGKQKLSVAAAQKDLDNAELALKRARSDLSTAVRNAYFTLLVDIETLREVRALARFTDEIYRMQTGLLRGTLAAPYEPASLRAQAFTQRLAYKQAVASYIYDWKALVATIGMQQLPLSQVAGQVDRLIPYYDYDRIRNYALQNHTDILTARNLVPQAKYNLKLAQITPVIPDLDLRGTFEKDYVVLPFGTYSMLTVGAPLPVWDQNRGNIMAAEAALIRASEEAHRVEVTLTNNLASAYANYQNNLFALEYYRRYILPDLVRYYRGIYARRQIDPNSAFGDLVTAQQNLATNVTAYLGVLQSMWMSVTTLADFLQTDDLFQVATPRELPEMVRIDAISWPCGHDALAASCVNCPPSDAVVGPVPRGPVPGFASVPSGVVSAPAGAGAAAAPGGWPSGGAPRAVGEFQRPTSGPVLPAPAPGGVPQRAAVQNFPDPDVPYRLPPVAPGPQEGAQWPGQQRDLECPSSDPRALRTGKRTRVQEQARVIPLGRAVS